MSNRTLFYSDGATVYQASDFIAPWKSAFVNGVFSGYNVLADSPADLSVSVQPGAANVNGYISLDDTAVPVPIVANTSGYNRIDVIVLDVDPVNLKTTIHAVQGTPSSSPTVPITTANQLPLAQVLVGNNVSVINTNVITNTRAFSFAFFPPGMILPYGGAVLPAHTLAADGSNISRTVYDRLFTVYGTTFGSGDGSTTFGLPDLRGRNVMGYNVSDSNFNALGKTGGSESQQFGLGSGAAAVGAEGTALRVSRSSLTFLSDVRADVGWTGVSEAEGYSARLLGTTDSGSVLDPYTTANYIITY